jgi:hypothetical protein
LQDPTTYSTAGLTLTFSAAPPSGTGNISVRYLGIPASNIATTAYRTLTEFTATAGQTTFTPPSYTAGYITVLRNGVQLGTADFTATNGTTVVLATGATAGDLITTISFLVSSVVGAIPATSGAVTSAYLLDGSVTQAKLSTNVASNGPAFSAYGSAGNNQVISNNTDTKVILNATHFDTASCFNTSTYRFTPNVAGYYQISGEFEAYANGSNITNAEISIFKNGTIYSRGTNLLVTTTEVFISVNRLIYFNGTTDYIELYARVGASNTITLYGDPQYRFLTGALVRAA